MSDKLSGNEVLAIDAGTQGLSAILWCPDRKKLLGVGEASYENGKMLNLLCQFFGVPPILSEDGILAQPLGGRGQICSKKGHDDKRKISFETFG